MWFILIWVYNWFFKDSYQNPHFIIPVNNKYSPLIYFQWHVGQYILNRYFDCIYKSPNQGVPLGIAKHEYFTWGPPAWVLCPSWAAGTV